jgi:hypothetical protein
MDCEGKCAKGAEENISKLLEPRLRAIETQLIRNNAILSMQEKNIAHHISRTDTLQDFVMDNVANQRTVLDVIIKQAEQARADLNRNWKITAGIIMAFVPLVVALVNAWIRG